MGSIAFVRLLDSPPDELARRSRAWAHSWDRGAGPDAVLVVAVPSAEATVLGAFQRTSEIAPGAVPLTVLRGSGGGVAVVGPGTVWMQLALARPDVLVACTADKLLNRYVRPLLRALTRLSSVPVSYFGRDWISAAHRPVALVAFAHEASSGRSLFEAIIAVSTPVALATRPSFLGKEPATLEEVAGRLIDPSAVADAITSAYCALANDTRELEWSVRDDARATPQPPWIATREEAIGTIAAGRDAAGVMRIGGELMASHDAVARLEQLAEALPLDASADDVARVVDEALTTRGAVVFGVRSLASIQDVILEARKG